MTTLAEMPESRRDILTLLKQSSGPLIHREVVRRLSHPSGTVSGAMSFLRDQGYINNEGEGYVLTLDGARLFQSAPQPTPPLTLHQEPKAPEVTPPAVDLAATLAEELPPLEASAPPSLREILEAELERLPRKPLLDGAYDAIWLLGALAQHHWATPSIAAELSRIADWLQQEAA